MMLTLKYQKSFAKDVKLLKRRGYDLGRLERVVNALSRGEKLPEQNHDHALTGNWVGHRECHVQEDWLLIYRIDDNELVLILTRTGTHSDLFKL